MEQSADLTTCAGKRDHSSCELAYLFWLADVLTANENSAIAILSEAIVSKAATRQKVIEAVCNCMLSQIKSAFTALVHDDESGEINCCDAVELRPIGATLTFEILQRALPKMNLALRLVLVLRLAEGYSTSETARLLNVEPTCVRKSFATAAVRLTRILQSQHL